MALDSLESNPLFKGMWKYVIDEGEEIEISLYARDRTLKFKTLTRQEIRSRHISMILEQAKIRQPFMLIAGKIYPDVKEILRQNHVTYLEANGNISLQHDDLFIWVDSNKPITIKAGRNNRAFTKTGLKVLLHFLMNDNFLNMPYREIADLTGTSLGNVTNVMNALKEAGYLATLPSGGYKLTNKKLLLDRWVAAYEQLLKPIIEIGTFKFINEQDHQNWRRVPLENRKSMWGAQAGAHLLTGQLRPHDLVIYSNESRNDIINHYRLVRDNDGYIKVYQKFWNYDDYRSNIAPPILIYADLLNIGDGNAMEAAKRIYDDFLKEKIKE